MKIILCLCAVVVAVAAFPQFPQFSQSAQSVERSAPVVQRTEVKDEAGQFSESYSTRDGQHFSEQGLLKRTPDGQDNVLVKQGSYQYVSPEGSHIRTDWQADENGFRAQGQHLPVAPAPVPATF